MSPCASSSAARRSEPPGARRQRSRPRRGLLVPHRVPGHERLQDVRALTSGTDVLVIEPCARPHAPLPVASDPPSGTSRRRRRPPQPPRSPRGPQFDARSRIHETGCGRAPSRRARPRRGTRPARPPTRWNPGTFARSLLRRQPRGLPARGPRARAWSGCSCGADSAGKRTSARSMHDRE